MTGSPPDVDRIDTDELRRLLIEGAREGGGSDGRECGAARGDRAAEGPEGPAFDQALRHGAGERTEAADRRRQTPWPRWQADAPRCDRGSGVDGRSAGGLALQGLR